MAHGENAADNAQFDLFDALLTAPAGKLDADQYSADDIDGVTESIFGSGNMAYASLQASQTNEVIALDGAVSMESGETHEQSGGTFLAGGSEFPNSDQISSGLQRSYSSRIQIADTDNPLGNSEFSVAENQMEEGDPSSPAADMIEVASLPANSGSFPSATGLNPANNNIENAISNNNVTTNVENNVVNVDMSVDGSIQNIVNTVTETIQNITNLGNEIIDNIIGGDIGEVVNIVNNEITDLTEMISTQVGDVTETINTILQDMGVTEVLNQMTNVTNGITETVANTVNEVLDNALGDGGLSLDLDAGILETLGTGLNIGVEDSIAGNIGTEILSDNLSGVVGDLTGLEVPLAGDLTVDIGFDLLTTGNGEPDGNDVSVAGIETPDIALDPLEGIVGDIDIETGLPSELADPGTLIGDLTDTLPGLDEIELSSPDEILDILGGQGADGEFDLTAGDASLGDELDIEADDFIEGTGALSGVEDGFDIGDAIDLLMSTVDDAAGDAGAIAVGDSSWTQSAIDAGGLFDDIVSGMGGESDILPDPAGTIAEGLGVLDMTPELDVSSLGGLFG